MRSKSKDTSESSEEDNRDRKFGVLTAKARRDFAKDCKQQGRRKIRLVKKQAKEKWASAAAAANAVPRTHFQDDECTFDFDTAEHPWAKIHESHQAWFADLVAYCRVCGAVNSKKRHNAKTVWGKTCQNKEKVRTQWTQSDTPHGAGLPTPWDENVAQNRR